MLLHSNFMFSRAPKGRAPLSNLQRFSEDLALLFDDLSANRVGSSRVCSSDFTLTDTENGALLHGQPQTPRNLGCAENLFLATRLNRS